MSAFACALSVAPAHAQTPASDSPPAPAAEETPPAESAGSDVAAQPIDLMAIDVTGNTLLDQRQIEAAVYPFTGPGGTLGDVERARKALEESYHKLGYQTVVVSIPEQDGRDGVIELQVVEARIGSVKVTANKHVSTGAIRRALPALREGEVPNVDRLQTQLAEQNRLAGRSIIPLLMPSETPGVIDAELEVEDKLPLHASVQLSNDHNANTRPLRLNATLSHSDLFDLGHSLTASYIVAPQDRQNVEVYSGSYVAPILGTPWTLTLYGYKSNSNVPALGGVRVLGNGYSLGARASLMLPQSTGFWHSLGFGVSYNDFSEVIDLGSTEDSAPIAYLPLTLSYTAGRYSDRSSSNATVGITAGVRGAGSDEAAFAARSFATGNFFRVNLDANHEQRIGKDVALRLRLSAQLADSHLVSGEQISAGGLDSVRGFLQSTAVGDNGAIASMELRLPSVADTLGNAVDLLQPFLFVDAAHTHTLRASADQRADTWLTGVGAGLEIGLLKTLTGQIAVGFPIKRPPDTAPDPMATFTVKAGF